MKPFILKFVLLLLKPVSNFILVERYAMDRKTKTWDEAVFKALENLPVEVIQVASDEGRSLIIHLTVSTSFMKLAEVPVAF
jgi:hypothetical protein